jgi:hypothetical protein
MIHYEGKKSCLKKTDFLRLKAGAEDEDSAASGVRAKTSAADGICPATSQKA